MTVGFLMLRKVGNTSYLERKVTLLISGLGCVRLALLTLVTSAVLVVAVTVAIAMRAVRVACASLYVSKNLNKSCAGF